MLEALGPLSKQTIEIQRKFWVELCSEAVSGSPPRQLAAYLSFLVISEKNSRGNSCRYYFGNQKPLAPDSSRTNCVTDKVIAACAYLQLVQIDGSAAYGILKASSMLRIVSTLSVVVGHALRKPTSDECNKQAEDDDAGDEETAHQPAGEEDFTAHFKSKSSASATHTRTRWC